MRVFTFELVRPYCKKKKKEALKVSKTYKMMKNNFFLFLFLEILIKTSYFIHSGYLFVFIIIIVFI